MDLVFSPRGELKTTTITFGGGAHLLSILGVLPSFFHSVKPLVAQPAMEESRNISRYAGQVCPLELPLDHFLTAWSDIQIVHRI